MKKEALIAVISGLVLGLIVTLGIYTANKSLEQQKLKKQASSLTNPIPSPDSSLNLQKTITVTSHANFDLVNQSEITLSGIAWKDAVVALLTEDDEYLIQADAEGIFSFKFDLIKGFNELTVIASDDTGDSQTLPLIITYSTTEIDN